MPLLVPHNNFELDVQESKFHLSTFGFPESDPILSHSLNQHLVDGFFLADADDADADADADADVALVLVLVLVLVPVVDADVAVVDVEDAVVVDDEDVVVVVDYDNFVSFVVVVVVDIVVDGVIFQFEHVLFVDGLGDLLVGLVCALLVVSHIG